MHKKLPQDLLKVFQDKNLIPVVGAGVSMSLTDEEGNRIFPSWVELLNHAADALREEGNETFANVIISMLAVNDFQQAASYARKGLKGGLWSQF